LKEHGWMLVVQFAQLVGSKEVTLEDGCHYVCNCSYGSWNVSRLHAKTANGNAQKRSFLVQTFTCDHSETVRKHLSLHLKLIC